MKFNEIWDKNQGFFISRTSAKLWKEAWELKPGIHLKHIKIKAHVRPEIRTTESCWQLLDTSIRCSEICLYFVLCGVLYHQMRTLWGRHINCFRYINRNVGLYTMLVETFYKWRNSHIGWTCIHDFRTERIRTRMKANFNQCSWCNCIYKIKKK